MAGHVLRACSICPPPETTACAKSLAATARDTRLGRVCRQRKWRSDWHGRLTPRWASCALVLAARSHPPASRRA
eukprot:11964962-Alexandrium_andersonii.AAC.1